jgi:hypothetical protein
MSGVVGLLGRCQACHQSVIWIDVRQADGGSLRAMPFETKAEVGFDAQAGRWVRSYRLHHGLNERGEVCTIDGRKEG